MGEWYKTKVYEKDIRYWKKRVNGNKVIKQSDKVIVSDLDLMKNNFD